MTNAFPKDITSYDLLKTLAVVLMIVDHVGVYFFPDEMWWRAVGRLSAPLWLFLIGYARSRDIPTKLWGGAAVLLVASFFITSAYFPVNILVGMVLVRLILDKAAKHMFTSSVRLVASCFVLLILVLPSYVVLDYGVMCLLIALVGYLVRWNDDQSVASKTTAHGFMAFVGITYALFALVAFNFNTLQHYVVLGGVSAIFGLLYIFKPTTFPKLTQRLPSPLTGALKLCGRRSLELYVGHLLLFKLLAFAMGIEGYGLFEWSWF